MPEITFNDANFQTEVLGSSAPVFVDFWAPWCGPCQQMGPMIEELAGEMDASKIKIGKMNVDENPETPGKYNVMSIPTYIIFKNGQLVAQELGAMPKEKLKAFIEKSIA